MGFILPKCYPTLLQPGAVAAILQLQPGAAGTLPATCQLQAPVMGYSTMAVTSTNTNTNKQTPQQAAQAALQAALQAQGASGATINLAALQAGRAYTLREVASAVGFLPRKRANGKQVYAPLRRSLRQAVANGKLVTATTGGYTTANGTTAGGKAFYMVVANS